LFNNDDSMFAERAYKLDWLDVSIRKARGQFDEFENEKTCTG
jgi:hypothetical protein